MKKIVFFIALSLSLMVSAQEVLTEGIIITKMTMSSDNDQMNAQLAAMGEVMSTTYFKGQKTRNESNSPMTGEMISISNGEAKEILILMNNPMAGKMYSKSSTELPQADLDAVTVKNGEETKTILGYNCKQYIITTSVQGQPMVMELFATDAFKAYSQQTATFADKIQGFPLYVKMTMSQGPSKMTIINEATEIKKEKVLDSKFDMTVPDGYTEIKQ